MARWAVVLVALMASACSGAPDAGRPVAAGEPSPSAPRTPPAAADAGEAKPFETKLVVLYQPDRVLRIRVPDVPSFAAYMKNVESTCNAFFASATAPRALDVVVAIKPDGSARVWFVGASPAGDDAALSVLKRKLESLSPPAIQSGPVAFAIVGSIAGAPRGDVDPATFEPPLPREWLDALGAGKQRAAIPDDVLPIVWP